MPETNGSQRRSVSCAPAACSGYLPSVHPRIVELTEYLRRQNGVLRRAYDAVPLDRRTARPAPERWSAAEVVQHVMLVNRSIAKLLRRLIADAGALARETESTPVIP